jgi:hypothetical protein
MKRFLIYCMVVPLAAGILMTGCEGDGDGGNGGDGGTSGEPSGVPCGPYTVELVYGIDTDIVIYNLWNDGSDYRDTFVSGTYIPQPGQSRPTGWTTTISQSANGVDLGTHTLTFENVRYNPVSFTLTIDGMHTCNYP